MSEIDGNLNLLFPTTTNFEYVCILNDRSVQKLNSGISCWIFPDKACEILTDKIFRLFCLKYKGLIFSSIMFQIPLFLFNTCFTTGIQVTLFFLHQVLSWSSSSDSFYLLNHNISLKSWIRVFNHCWRTRVVEFSKLFISTFFWLQNLLSLV